MPDWPIPNLLMQLIKPLDLVFPCTCIKHMGWLRSTRPTAWEKLWSTKHFGFRVCPTKSRQQKNLTWMSRAKRLAVASSKQRKLLTLNPWSVFEVILISLCILHVIVGIRVRKPEGTNWLTKARKTSRHVRGMLPWKSLSSRVSEMPFPAFWGVILQNSKHYKTS